MAELITTDDLAEELGVTSHCLRRWRTQNKGPAYVHVGRLVRYRRADIERWLAKNRSNKPSRARRLGR